MKNLKTLQLLTLVALLSMSNVAMASNIQSTKINEQQATDITKKYVPEKSKLLLTTQDNDDNKYTYESTYIVEKDMTYKVEVDAYTGEVLEYEAKKLNVDYSNAKNKYYKNKTYNPKITQKKAEELAMKDWPDTPKIISTTLEEEDNLWTYIVKFKTDTYIAEVDVDTEKELIREQNYKKFITTSNVTVNTTQPTVANTTINNTSGVINSVDAISIAQQKVPNALLKDIDIDSDDRKYEMDFREGNIEYDIEVDFKGNIVKFDKDYDD